jgi:hypothetical protein
LKLLLIVLPRVGNRCGHPKDRGGGLETSVFQSA